MMQGCHTLPPPPPHPMVSPLAWQVGSCLLWPCCFHVWSCLASSPPPLWSGACGLFGWPRPACGLVPSLSVGWGLWSFWLAPPRLCGAVCSTEIWYGCCRLLAAMSSLRARYHTTYDVALFSLQTVPLSLL